MLGTYVPPLRLHCTYALTCIFRVARLAVPTAQICCKDIHYWLVFSRRRLAITRQSNPTAVVGLDSHAQVKLDTAISANSQIVDAVRTPERRPLPRPVTARSNRAPCSGIASLLARMASILAP